MDLVPLACEDAVAQKGNLKKHTKSQDKHGRYYLRQKPFAFDYCGKAFAQKGNLKKHTESHTKQGKFYHWPRKET